jgi:hypothetical protein
MSREPATAVLESAVISTRTNCTFSGAAATRTVWVPPKPVNVPVGKSRQVAPAWTGKMASLPVQYCTRNRVA